MMVFSGASTINPYYQSFILYHLSSLLILSISRIDFHNRDPYRNPLTILTIKRATINLPCQSLPLMSNHRSPLLISTIDSFTINPRYLSLQSIFTIDHYHQFPLSLLIVYAHYQFLYQFVLSISIIDPTINLY